MARGWGNSDYHALRARATQRPCRFFPVSYTCPSGGGLEEPGLAGPLTFIGSGEVSAGMVKVHRSLLALLPDPGRAVRELLAAFERGIAGAAGGSKGKGGRP